MTDVQEGDRKPRQLSVFLLIGMLTVPIFFGWLFLRRGYARSLRRIALIYTIIMTAVPMIGRLGS